MMFRALILVCLALLAAPAIAVPALAASGPRIVVPSQDIPRGQTISEHDLSYLPVSTARSDVITALGEVAGMEARRYLRAGEAVRPSDLRRPVLIAKGATVSMTVEMPGVSLTAMGRALGEGGLGETITVLNPASYRQIMATVTGPGTVRAEAAMPMPSRAPRMAAARN